ncbi:MAG: AAA family ATPase [Deltaproteobacteria bacterium]|nr:AAA family ATPase [Deltaproteobacteria bacterium]
MVTQIKTLGKYHILERLVTSPLAEVYKVKTVGIAGFEKLQVLKRVTPRYCAQPEFVRAFIDEAKISFTLNHRNIEQVFEFGRLENELFVATEYIPGVNLEEVLHQAQEQRWTAPVGLVCYLMGEVAAGLDYAHRKTDQGGRAVGLIHCDLGPHNIACSFEGSVKILEFGSARAAWQTVPAADRPRTLPRYLSPEQVRGEPLTPATDIFSFGVILWEALTGRPLFDGDTIETVLQNVLYASIPPPDAVNEEVPPPLTELTVACLERRVERRPASANELQLKLHRIQRDVGAVIGSRALSSFLQQLFPEHNETRDVRQVSARRRSAPPRPPPPSSRVPDLLDAAAELAQPPNPPPLPVSDRLTPEATQRPRGRSEAAVQARRRRTTEEARVAGLLRSTRYPDDDPAPARSGGGRPASRGASEGPRPGSAASSQEKTPSIFPPEGSVSHDVSLTGLDGPRTGSSSRLEGSRTGSRTGLDAPPTASEPALAAEPSEAPATLDGPRTDGGRSSREDLEALAKATQPDAPPVSGASPPAPDPLGTPSPTLLAQPLGEKKRFIAVALRFDGLTAPSSEALQLIADIAYKLEGLLHDHDGQWVVALFGLPVADEHDIVAAVRFVHDVRDALEHLYQAGNDTWPGQDAGGHSHPAVRAALRAGTARITSGTDGGSYQVLGNTIEDTLALAEHAARSAIYLTGAAARLAAQHYRVGEAPSFERRGKSTRCHRLLGPRSGASEKRQASDALVGREMEIKAIRGAWRECAVQHDQRTVLVVGEPGVGKTSLVDDFLQRHVGEARVLYAAGRPHRRASPYALVIDLLGSLTGTPNASSTRGKARALDGLRGLLSGEDERLRDETLEILSAVLQPGAGTVADSGIGFSGRRVYEAVRLVLNRVARLAPLVVAIEDLHWADGSSLDCVRSLVERGEDATGQLLFLVSARPEEGFDHAAWNGFPQLSTVVLHELDQGDRQRLIGDELGEGVGDKLRQEVERRAGGNPFYIRELCRALAESPPAGAAEIPATIRGVIASRVDRLPSDVKLVLQHATVIGPSFREGILTQLLARNPARALGLLRNRRILAPGVSAVGAPAVGLGVSEQFERTWTFRHVLVQEVVYDSLSSVDRRALHQRVSEILRRRASRGFVDPPLELARHLELAGLAREAGEHYLRAAHEAAATYAHEEALELFGRALRLAEGNPALQFEALAGRERIHGRLAQHDQQALDLDALRRLCGDDPARVSEVRTREAVFLLRGGELYRALECAERAEEAAGRAGDELLRGEALRLRGEAYGRLNDHGRAIDAASRALAIFEGANAPAHQVRARLGLGRICLMQARYDDALQHYDPALELIKQTGDRWQEHLLRNNLAVVYACRGDFSRAIDEAMYSLRLCQQFGDRAREGDNASVLGIVHLAIGMHESARQYLEDALAIHRETASPWGEADTLVYAGLLETAEGNYSRALELLEQARGLAEPMGARYITVAARNAIAWTLCDRNQPGDAAKAVDEATEAFETARQAQIVVGEIPGLSRAARGTALLGNLEAARALSRRAVELLDEQRLIEGAEEEIHYTHYRILRALGEAGAGEWLERAHSTYLTKMAALEDPEARQAFSERVRLNVAIRRDYLKNWETLTGSTIDRTEERVV